LVTKLLLGYANGLGDELNGLITTALLFKGLLGLFNQGYFFNWGSINKMAIKNWIYGNKPVVYLNNQAI